MIVSGRFVGLLSLALVISATTALFGCGGGGGGGGGGAPSGPSFVASPPSLNFSALANSQTPVSQAISITLNGSASGTLFFRVTITGGAVSGIPSGAEHPGGRHAREYAQHRRVHHRRELLRPAPWR